MTLQNSGVDAPRAFFDQPVLTDLDHRENILEFRKHSDDTSETWFREGLKAFDPRL